MNRKESTRHESMDRLEALLDCLGRVCCRPAGSSSVQEDLAQRYVSRIVIRFEDEFAKKLPYEDDAQDSLGKIDPHVAQRWEALERKYGKLRLRPGITTLDAEQIKGVVRLALETARRHLDTCGEERKSDASAGGEADRFLREYIKNPPNFLAFFFLTAPVDRRKTRALLKDLRAWQGVVKFVYLDAPAPPPGPTGFDPAVGTYVNLAPHGIGATAIDSQFDGSGTSITVLEQSWWAPHSDLPPLHVVGSAAPSTNLREMAHGTAVLGILAARKNQSGMSGLAHAATIKVASFGFFSSDDLNRRDQRIYDALMALLPRFDNATGGLLPGAVAAGDVLLLEAQAENRYTYVDEEGEWTDIWFVPVEQKPLTFEAIRTAVALQVIVIEPAGNYYGGPPPSNLQNLADPLNNIGGNPAQSMDPNSANFADSGAIVVGATGNGVARLKSSNFGNRIDCYAPGLAIPSCTVVEDANGNEVEVLVQNAASSMTSAASAIVAGAALIIQKMALAAPGFGRRLTPDEMRRLLRNVAGTTVIHPPGLTPGGMLATRYVANLAAIFNQLQAGVIP